MKLLTAVVVILLFALAVEAHEVPLGTAHQIVITGMCDGWTAYRTGEGLTVLCPGYAPPPGAVELREYYTVKRSGPR